MWLCIMFSVVYEEEYVDCLFDVLVVLWLFVVGVMWIGLL